MERSRRSRALAEAGCVLDEPRSWRRRGRPPGSLVGVHLDGVGATATGLDETVPSGAGGVLEDYACRGRRLAHTLRGDRRPAVVTTGASRLRATRSRTRFGDGDGRLLRHGRRRGGAARTAAGPNRQRHSLGSVDDGWGAAHDAAASPVTSRPPGCEALRSHVAGLARQAPRFAGQGLAVAEALRGRAAPGRGRRGAATTRAEGLGRAAFRLSHPGLVVAQGDAETDAPCRSSRVGARGRPGSCLRVP